MNYAGLIGGLGIFLFGMILFEETIRSFSTHSLRRVLKKSTSNRFKSMFVGIVQTVVLQSSTVATMMTLGFVGAGVLGVLNALGIVIGANIGTTLTPWVIAILGFNLQIDTFALPMIGIGALLMMAGPTKLHHLSKIIVGFGFIFLGLDFMKDSVEALRSSVAFDQFNHPPFIGFILIGLLITVVIQTSTGATVIFLTALNAGLITLDISLALVIGANLGSAVTTTLMGIISSKKDQYEKKQVALGHLFFNIVTFVVVIPIYPFVYKSLFVILGQNASPVLLLALFHTLYNVILAAICLPFLQPIMRLLRRIFPAPENSLGLLIERIDPNNTEELFAALITDTGKLIEKTCTYSRSIWRLEGPHEHEKSLEHYIDIKKMESMLLNTMVHAGLARDHEFQRAFQDMKHLIMEVIVSSKYLKDIAHHIDNLYAQKDHEAIQKSFVFLQETIDVHTRYSSEKQKILAHTAHDLDILSSINIEYDPEINTSEIMKVTYYVQLSLHTLTRAHRMWHTLARHHAYPAV